jgi:5-methylcytosine-specific restriction endonuclease McrA
VALALLTEARMPKNTDNEWMTAWWTKYQQYLRSPQWQQKRQQVLERDGHRCQARMSGCRIVANQVHHRDYAMALDAPLFDLVSVCGNCHDAITSATRSMKSRRRALKDLWEKRLKAAS